MGKLRNERSELKKELKIKEKNIPEIKMEEDDQDGRVGRFWACQVQWTQQGYNYIQSNSENDMKITRMTSHSTATDIREKPQWEGRE